MTKAVIAREQGDAYQARHFWLQACRLFEEHSHAEQVCFELDALRSIDDIGVFYRSGMQDDWLKPLSADFFQVKFHVDCAGGLTWQAFLDPAFINARSVCLLTRIHKAFQCLLQQGLSCRLNLVLPWPIHPDNPLAKIISNYSGGFRMDVLFDGTGPRSTMGKIRAAWRKALELTTDKELREVLHWVRIWPNAGSLEALRDRLNDKLRLAGFAPVEDGRIGNPYDDLIQKLHAAGQRRFTREELEKIARQEGLWRGAPQLVQEGKVLGVRSFMRWAEYMEDETDAMVCLVRHFDGREIRGTDLWKEAVIPDLRTFLSPIIPKGEPLTLCLDTHSTVAFAAGQYLEAKSGVRVAVRQRTHLGTVVWDAATAPGGAEGLWEFEEVACRPSGAEVAVAISVTHDVLADVQAYVTRSLPCVGRILSFAVRPGPGPTAVRDGAHASSLAQELVATIRKVRASKEWEGPVHVFSAAPNGLMFRIGQLSRSLGRCLPYEYDFDRCAPGAYEPTIILPTPS
jgi:hypothetical protein